MTRTELSSRIMLDIHKAGKRIGLYPTPSNTELKKVP